MAVLILLRHGLSEWNALNQFTGWVDIPLSKKGVEEAQNAGRKIRDIPLDAIFTSTLIRAHETLTIAMREHASGKTPLFLHQGEGRQDDWSRIYNEKAYEQCIPVHKTWQLNERMYGELQGLNKAETAERFGADQVKIWRRSFDTAPPGGESLKMTTERTLPYFKETILPLLKQGKNLLVSAHGNSLRSIVMSIDNLTPDEVLALEIPTGEPLIYHLKDDVLVRK